MRLKDYNDRDGKRVWLSESEIDLFLKHRDADHGEMHAAFILAARCGLRREEIVNVRPSDIQHTDTGTVVRVWEGKGDKYREPPAPDELSTLALGMGGDPGDPLVNRDPSTIYGWVQRAAQRCRARTSDEGWQFVGPHDLRRSWGVRLLENGVVPSVVMEWGGWEDWQTFRDHYLSEFSPEALRQERGKVSWLGHEAETAEKQSYAVLPGSGAVSSGR